MERKLVKHGPTTLMVSVPKKWIDQHELVAGDPLTVQLGRGSILYSTSTHITRSQIQLDVTGEVGASLRNTLVAAYRLGYQEVILSCSAEQIDEITEVVSKLLPGWVLKEVSTNSCLIQGVPLDEAALDELQRKYFLNLEQLLAILLGHEEPELLEAVESIIQTIDNQIRRHIMSASKAPELAWSFQSELTRAQRELYRVAKNNEKHVASLVNELRRLLKEVQRARKLLELSEIIDVQKQLRALADEFLASDCSARLYTATRMCYLACSSLYGLAHLEATGRAD